MIKKLLAGAFLSVLVLISYKAATYSGGPPNATTNAPGEANCTSCHTGTLNSGTAQNNITLTTSTSLAALQPNTTYTFTLGFSEAGRTKYGFQLCVLASGANSGAASIGTLMATSSETFSSSTTIPARRYLMHHSSGTAAPLSSKTWQFQYKTPATLASHPVFYVSVNSSNNDNASSGDLIYTQTFTATILPVKWGTVSVQECEKGINLRWTTYTEVNNERFDIEKSTNGYDWKTIGTLKGNGHSVLLNTYSFIDEEKSKNAFYRVKQTDYNGMYDYSKTVFIGTENLQPEIRPLYHASTREILLPDAEISDVKLTDMKGNSSPVITALQDGFIRIDTQPFASGVYLLSARQGISNKYWKVFID